MEGSLELHQSVLTAIDLWMRVVGEDDEEVLVPESDFVW